MTEIVRAFEGKVTEVLDGERSVVARINTATVDRFKTIIDPLGCDTTHFNRSASVLWQHGLDPIRGTVPIGTGWAQVRKSERDIVGKTKFAKDEFSQLLFDGCKEGTIRGWSIKAGVLESSPPTHDEIRSNPALSDCEMIYRKWDLIEYSLTPTPGNSDCLSLLVSRGLVTAPEGFVPTEHVVTLPTNGKWLQFGNTSVWVPATGNISRYITGSGDEWTVHAEDGKVLGKHKTKGEAEAQLAAIEAHKHDDKERAITAVHTAAYVEGTTVYNVDGTRAASFPDEASALECLQLMRGSSSAHEREVIGLMGELQVSRAAMRAEMQEFINLWRYGRV